MNRDMKVFKNVTVTYGHRLERIGHPVRSAIHKLHNHVDSTVVSIVPIGIA